jgi:type IV pilus assembly protein PilZ
MRPLLSDWSAMPPPDELRINPRAPLRLRIDYDRMNAFFADYTKNISKGGTFIKTTRPLEVGSRCQFALSLPALSEPLLLEGEVVWTLSAELARDREAEPGMGIRFVFADEAARHDFEKLVQRMLEESLGPEIARGLLRR